MSNEKILEEGCNTISIGQKPMGGRVICIGRYAGSEVEEFPTGSLILGDNIKNFDVSQDDVLIIGDKIAIGNYISGLYYGYKDTIVGALLPYLDKEKISLSGETQLSDVLAKASQRIEASLSGSKSDESLP